MPQGVDISAVRQYFQQQGQEVFAGALAGSRLAQDYNLIPGIKDQYYLPSFQDASNLVQSYSATWNPAKAGDHVERMLQVTLAKVDIEEEPLKYRNVWLAERLRAGANAYDHPFERFLLDRVASRIVDQVQTNMVMNGDTAATGVDTSVTIIDGFLKIIADEITASNLTAISTGAVIPAAVDLAADNNTVTILRSMFQSIDPRYRSAQMNMYIDHSVYDAYVNHYQRYIGNLVYNTEFDKVALEGTGGRVTLKPEFMGGSQRVIIAPRDVMAVGVDTLGDMESFEVEQDKRMMNIFTQFPIGVQIADLKQVFVNDQA